MPPLPSSHPPSLFHHSPQIKPETLVFFFVCAMDPAITAMVAAFREKSMKRAFVPISRQQAVMPADMAAKGPIWVSRACLPVAQLGNLRQVVLDAVRAYDTGNDAFAEPDAVDVP